MSTAGMPDFSGMSTTKPPPMRLTRLLAIELATSSRFSRCRPIGFAKAVAQRRREVVNEILSEMPIVGQIGIQKLVVQPDLAVREENRQLRPGQPPALRGTFRQPLVIREELDRAVEPARRSRRRISRACASRAANPSDSIVESACVCR